MRRTHDVMEMSLNAEILKIMEINIQVTLLHLVYI